MIEVLIYYLHIIAAVYIYTKYWQNESIAGGLMGLGLFGILFSIGWVMVSFIINLIFSSEFGNSFINRDTITLLLLSLMELFFFIKYFLKDDISVGK